MQTFCMPDTSHQPLTSLLTCSDQQSERVYICWGSVLRINLSAAAATCVQPGWRRMASTKASIAGGRHGLAECGTLAGERHPCRQDAEATVLEDMHLSMSAGLHVCQGPCNLILC